jgi:iduronate 2-sulfatase
MLRITFILSCLLAVGYPIGAQSVDQPPNILLICVDDLRPEIAAFGTDYIITPNMDRLAASGRAFRRHYVNAPSCGPSRFTLLTGRYGPSPNEALFQRAAALEGGREVPPSMPEWFRQNGYRTVSVGKVSHHPGGMGGQVWNDSSIIEMPGAWDAALMPTGDWQHPRGSMHGLANGHIRSREPYTMDVMEAAPGEEATYPDDLITYSGREQLRQLAAGDEPFLLAVGLIKPHLPFGAPRRFLELYDAVEMPRPANPAKPKGVSTWHGSGEFRRYRLTADPLVDSVYADSLRRHYAACVSYADDNIGKLLATLAETGADRNTIVILWGDHGWNLGHHAIWGKHNLFEEALHSPLIVSYPGMPAAGVQSEAIVESSGLFPTLCELTGLPVPDFTHGRSFAANVRQPEVPGRPAVGYYGEASTIRTDRYRLVAHPGGRFELYDHRDDAYELRNVAESEPTVVNRLSELLGERLAPRIVSY